MQPNQSLPTQETPTEAAQDSGVMMTPTESRHEVSSLSTPPKLPNVTWAKDINKSNKIYIIICAVLIAGVDTPIVLSSPSLFSFYVAMLQSFGALGIFALIEYLASRRLRNTKRSATDEPMLVLVHLRNYIILLNVIPGIQLLGWLATFFVAPFIVLAQTLIISIRLYRSRSSPNSVVIGS